MQCSPFAIFANNIPNAISQSKRASFHDAAAKAVRPTLG